MMVAGRFVTARREVAIAKGRVKSDEIKRIEDLAKPQWKVVFVLGPAVTSTIGHF